jgi:hypothetical protein
MVEDYQLRRSNGDQGEQEAAASAVSLEVQKKFANYLSGNGQSAKLESR